MKTKIDIRQLSLEELISKIEALGEKKFRAKQVHEWLWKKRAIDFNQMTNLSKSLRNLLEENFIINGILLKEAQKSKDKTIKNAFLLFPPPVSAFAAACFPFSIAFFLPLIAVSARVFAFFNS